MGRSQKTKGRNQEYGLRNHLRSQGWLAERVYASGAIAGLPGDVKATHPVHGEVLFEVKSRKDAFKRIYVMLDAWRKLRQDDLMALAIPAMRLPCVNVSTSLEATLDSPDVYEVAGKDHPLYAEFSRTIQKVGNLQGLLGKAQVLAVKDDRKPWIFLRYR